MGDPLYGALHAGAEIGVLGIESHTRRRNRVNGRVSEADAAGFRFQVEQSFGNCPKYITERVARYVAPSPQEPRSQRSASLSHEAQRWIAAADTFFIATGYRGEGESETFGMDASHRGGPPGFVRVIDEGTLVTSYYDWSDIHPEWRERDIFPIISEPAIRATLGILDRTLTREARAAAS